MSVLKVAIVTPSFGESGGVANVASFLYRQLKRSGNYSPHVFSIPMPSGVEENVQLTRPVSWLRGVGVRHDEREGIPFREYGALLSEFEFQRYRPRPALTRELEQYDLVQVVAGIPIWAYVTKNVSTPVALQVATLTAVEREGKYSHESVFLRLWRSGMTKVATLVERRVPSLLDVVFVENQWMYDHYRQHHPEVDVYFAPPGVDTSVYRPGTDEKEKNDYILSVGRFSDPRKNVELLFEAYAQLRRNISDAPRLVLAGLTGPSESAWETAKSLGIGEHVDLHVDVPEEELARLYRHADLFVLSSKEEGLGIVIAEAMASGVPVVSTDCGGPSTLIVEGETGYLTPVGDPESLKDRMQNILENSDHAKELGERGRRRVEEHFSEEAAGKKFLDVYDRLLD